MKSGARKISLVLSIFSVLLLLPQPANAQVKDLGGITDVRDVSGLQSCATLGFFKSLVSTSCGDTFTTSGSFTIGDVLTANKVPYSSGDIAKCSWIPVTSSATCVVSHPDKTATLYETSAKSSALTTTQYDATGNVVGTPTHQSDIEATLTKPLGNVADSAAELAVKAVAAVILSIANFLLATAGVILNWVVVKTVFQFGSLIGNSSGLLVSWGILRDIGNMVLLFGFIFMGLATILDLHSFPTKKAIPQLLLFAILMNFSLFAAEAVIDTSNALSSVMYSQANTNPCNGLSDTTVAITQGTKIDDSEDCAINYGISAHIMQATGLSSIFKVDAGAGQSAVTFIMLALFATVGAIVLFAASIMLIVRVVVLTFLMVSAPVGFAGMAVPMFRGFADKWWKKLLGESFFAPVMFLLIFVSLKVTDSFTGTTATTDGLATKTGLAQYSLAGAVTAPGSSTMGIFLVFFIVIGFLVGSLIAAKNVGSSGAGFAVSTAKGLVLGTYGVTGGFLGRNTLGRGGGVVQKKYEAWAGRDTNSKVGMAARALVRNNILGLDSGISGAIGKVKDGKYGGSQSYEERTKTKAERLSHLKHVEEQQSNKRKLDAAISSGKDEEVARILQTMSTSEIEATDYVKKGAAGIEILARNLSPEKFEQMMKNDKFDHDAKHRLSHKRFAPFGDHEGNGGMIQALNDTEIRKWSAKDLAIMAKNDPSLFESLIKGKNKDGDSLISTDQYDALVKNDVLSNIQKQMVRDESRGNRIDRLLSRAGGRVPTLEDIESANTLIKTIAGAKNVAKLSGNVLSHPMVASQLTIPQLAAIITEDKLTDKQQKELAAVINARAKKDESIRKYIDQTTNPIAAAYYSHTP